MKRRNKARSGDARIVIYTRIKSETVHALDEIRESMPFTPTRAQVIDAALAEYVDNYGKKPRTGRSAKTTSHYDQMVKLAQKSPPDQSWFDEDFSSLRQPR